MWIPIAAIAFVTIFLVTAICADAYRKKAKLEILRLAIEKGQTLDPALVDKLLAFGEQTSLSQSHGTPAARLRFIGLMCLGCGVGLTLFGYFLRDGDPKAFATMRGAGAFIISMAVVWFIAAILARRKATSVDQTT
jgi:hypothetical protein